MSESNRARVLRRYYRWHAPIYDRTRWGFLFGRNRLLDHLVRIGKHRSILEIGCGTGTNLRRLGQRCPGLRLTGVDTSTEMLAVAARKLRMFGDRIELRHGFYPDVSRPEPSPDLILFSYCLSMIEPGWETAVAAASHDLSPRGTLAVVDFHDSPWPAFRRWMGLHHVRMEGQLLPGLVRILPHHQVEIFRAYGGLWRYFIFLGYNNLNNT